ncbi:MYND-type domain-containing protein [Mycena sanguinolenta]|uniref:MYND-type domain-containing protein n=1 Tax=Mycena sanguinolenta TaxID=230812 RepID=A0A8H7D7I3_9AGAR|nr:MYND-type domain-containing protein [Mycena sanguinolenta]
MPLHPAVDIKNIKRLPGPQSRVALAACADSPSFHDFERAASLMESAPASQKILYLPVFYIALDPAKIPRTEDLESLRRDSTAPIAYAALSLGMIFLLTQSKKGPSQLELGTTLWPRVWAWFQFMHEHREHLPHGAMNDLFYYQFLGFVEDTSLRRSVTSAPGFRVILARAWALLHRMKSLEEGFHICLNLVALFLRELDFMNPVHFTEMIDGAGGSLEDLAFLSAELLEHAIEEHSVMCLDGLMAFIMGDLDVQPAAGLSLRINFIETLRQDDFLTLLPAAMDTLVHTAPPDLVSVWRRGFGLLECLLHAPKAYPWFPAAIRGSLINMMAGASLRFPGDLDHNLRFYLTKLLPENMVYYNVVVAIGEILDDLSDDLEQEQFEGLEIFPDWLQFLDLAKMRVKLMRGLAGAQVLKACDNVECGEIRDRSECRRCSGCNTFYYCNQQCQMADWRRGDHRNHCGSSMMLSLAESRHCTLGFRERQFMRALIQDDYLGESVSIYEQQLELMAADPDALLFTLFDYTYTPVQISVHPITNSPITDALSRMGTEWTDLVSRAKRSRGRMQLHVIQVSEGIDTRLWVTPLRTSSSVVRDAVRELAMSLPADYDEELLEDAANEVVIILDDADHLVQIH